MIGPQTIPIRALAEALRLASNVSGDESGSARILELALKAVSDLNGLAESRLMVNGWGLALLGRMKFLSSGETVGTADEQIEQIEQNWHDLDDMARLLIVSIVTSAVSTVPPSGADPVARGLN